MSDLPSYSVPQFLRRRAPDVPEDVDDDDLLLHFNDPNYDLRSLKSCRSSTSFELDEKKRSFGGAESIDYSSRASDVDTESQLGTTTRGADSQAPLHLEHNECVCLQPSIDSPANCPLRSSESAYPEVRAAVSNVDDPLMPVNTFRMWFLGIFYSVLITALNQIFAMRCECLFFSAFSRAHSVLVDPSVYISGLVAQLTALPLGKLLELILPTARFNTFGYTWSFNPGPFNIKEHTVITVMATVVTTGAYATDVIATQRVFYNENWGIGYQLLLCLSSQLIGYSFAGLVRQFLVWPASMIWPGALVNAALFNTLHKNFGKKERKHISRERFFCIALAGSFVWYWVPGYLFQGLSIFNWVCWAAPNNLVVNQLFGTISGLGMSVFTLDWSMISYIGSPLVSPWWSEVNTFASFVLWFWIITPIVYCEHSTILLAPPFSDGASQTGTCSSPSSCPSPRTTHSTIPASPTTPHGLSPTAASMWRSTAPTRRFTCRPRLPSLMVSRLRRSRP